MDPREFDDLYRSYWPRVFGYCRKILSSDEEAEDAAQEAFIRVYRSYHPQRGPIEPFLFRVARNVCLDCLRRRRPEVPFPDFDLQAEKGELEADLAEIVGQRVDLERCLSRLSADEQWLLWLRFRDAVGWDEIAAVIGIPPSTAVSRVKAALKRVRDCLLPSS